ncbi:hypothetical protein CY34DRAFT_208728 [Suillus luteus UH-Slu-Lm8-n1]|uniref:Uncharacterized protein n=1 Tax=Suillus luteus UH-Slu-Lm8-n1 TaxID=930992 RepID=A0A0D0BXG2_9AGAM|nr:hypothetical protein CY34DRAFT_208728 [Suillus luteus UH-Slu-Lm8-n1]
MDLLFCQEWYPAAGFPITSHLSLGKLVGPTLRESMRFAGYFHFPFESYENIHLPTFVSTNESFLNKKNLIHCPLGLKTLAMLDIALFEGAYSRLAYGHPSFIGASCFPILCLGSDCGTLLILYVKTCLICLVCLDTFLCAPKNSS